MVLNSSRVIFSARASKVGGIPKCLSSGTDGLSNFDLQKSSMVLSGSGSGGGLPKDPSKIALMTFDGFSSYSRWQSEMDFARISDLELIRLGLASQVWPLGGLRPW